MNKIKHLAISFLQFCVRPCVRNEKLFLRIKDILFVNSAEHLIRAVNYIRSKNSNANNQLIIDIGSADGGTPVFFSKKFPECKVVGFEPINEMYAKSVAHCSSHINIEIRNLALSDVEGEKQIHITENFLSSSLNELDATEIAKEEKSMQEKVKETKSQKIKTSTLDIQFPKQENILLMKLDTQGTELNILKGGAETLKRTKFVLVEMNNHRIYKNTCQYYDVDAFLRSQSFQLADIVVTYRGNGFMKEYDALYENTLIN